MHDHLEFLRPYYEQAWRRRRRARVTVAFGIQGSGQHVGRRARPGRLPRARAGGGGARLRLDLGRRPHLVPQPDPRRRRRAVDVRGRHGADHARRRRRAAAAAPPERRREGVRVARLRLRRPRRSSASASAARARRTSRRSASPSRERGARTDEAMRALRALFAGEPARSRGPVLLASRTSRSSRGSRSPAARRSGSAAAPRRRSGARRRSATAGSRSGSRPSGFAAGYRRSCPSTSRRAVTLPAHVGDKRHLLRAPARSATPATSPSTSSTATASPARRRSAPRGVREYLDAGARHVVFNIAASPRTPSG